MSLSLQKAILATVIYGDIFEFPLTKDEINKWLIGINYKRKIEDYMLRKIKNLQVKDKHYFLKGRMKIIDIRRERKKYSQRKVKIAEKIANLLKLIPPVKMIGVTGALAVDNAKKDDDIDLYIVTSHDMVWITRFFATILTEITGMRRHPNETEVNDKICLNMFTDENYLAVPKSERDLFSAHEVVQMKLIWERENTYKKFLIANKWVERYLPNAYEESVLTISNRDTPNDRKPVLIYPDWRDYIIGITELLLKRFQLWYMRNRRTTEVIKKGIIRFHPHDARIWIMEKYKSKLPS